MGLDQRFTFKHSINNKELHIDMRKAHDIHKCLIPDGNLYGVKELQVKDLENLFRVVCQHLTEVKSNFDMLCKLYKAGGRIHNSEHAYMLDQYMAKEDYEELYKMLSRTLASKDHIEVVYGYNG